MKRERLFSILFGLCLALGFLAISFVQAAQRAIGASYQDIMSAMGPDALGLEISPEKLPDISSLALSRLEDDEDKFIVEHPYTAGRWKGGKATIEYARDLSYAMISIYDKKGKRQRIYSVSARPPEPMPDQPPVQETLADREAAQLSRANHRVTVFTSDESEYNQDSAEGPHPSHRASSSSMEVASAVPGSAPVTPGAAVMAESGAAISTTRASASRATARKTQSGQSSSASNDETVPSTVGGYEWDDAKGAYVPVKMSAGHRRHPKQTTTTTEEVPTPAQGQPPSVHATEVVAMAPAPIVHNESSVWLPNANPASAPAAAQPPKGENVPSTEELLSAAAPTTQMASAQDSTVQSQTNPSTHKRKKKKHSETAVTQNASPANAVPSTENLSSSSGGTSDLPAGQTGPDTSASDAWKPKATPPSKAQPEPELPAAPVRTTQPAAVPSTEDLLAGSGKTGPDTSESDAWAPRPVKTPKASADSEEPVQVAMLPKPAVARGDAADNLLRGGQSPSAAAAESDAWVPRKTALPPADTDLNRALANLKPESPTERRPVVKINRDINNPEEGVLPVNSFEKFSGPRYGRHREYERRLFFGKKTKSTVQNYDFYVDEVDRKKEIHNVYYYRKGKVPKLIAVEKHDHVTFMSNYDVDKEDKGKISQD